MAKKRPVTFEILCYSLKPAPRAKIRRRYARWREENGLPVRCDFEGCEFHTSPLIWRGGELPLILDHANGNSRDNRPSNLRLLCPNCDAQLPTRGGGNRGRVKVASETEFTIIEKTGTRHYHIIPKGAECEWVVQHLHRFGPRLKVTPNYKLERTGGHRGRTVRAMDRARRRCGRTLCMAAQQAR